MLTRDEFVHQIQGKRVRVLVHGYNNEERDVVASYRTIDERMRSTGEVWSYMAQELANPSKVQFVTLTKTAAALNACFAWRPSARSAVRPLYAAVVALPLHADPVRDSLATIGL